MWIPCSPQPYGPCSPQPYGPLGRDRASCTTLDGLYVRRVYEGLYPTTVVCMRGKGHYVKVNGFRQTYRYQYRYSTGTESSEVCFAAL